VYRQLLTEEVSLRDIVSIATALVEGSESSKDPVLLCADVRYALRRNIVPSIGGERKTAQRRPPASPRGNAAIASAARPLRTRIQPWPARVIAK
jgi:hypothetical protein